MKMKLFTTATAIAVMLSAMPSFSTTAQTVTGSPAARSFVTEGESSADTAVTTTTTPADAAVTTTVSDTSDADVTTTTAAEPTTTAVTYTVRFYDFTADGQTGDLIGKQTVYDLDDIDYSQIDISHTLQPDAYTEVGFSSWSTPELQEDGSYAVYALSIKAVFNVDDISEPYRNLYYSRSGRVRLDGLTLPLTITTQIDERGEDGQFITESVTEDVTDSCYCEPATLDEAFAAGDAAAVSVYSPGEEKPLYTYIIYCQDCYGDVNSDNFIDSSDAAIILKYYANAQADPENNVPTDEFKKASDVNFDDTIDSSDAAAIIRYYALHQADSSVDLGDANGVIKYDPAE